MPYYFISNNSPMLKNVVNSLKDLSNPKQWIVFLALLLSTAGTALGQTANNAYIFYNNTYGYLINNGGNPGVSTSFNKNAIWVANNTMGTNNRNVRSYTDESKFFTGSAGTNNNTNGTFSLGNTNDNWQLRGTNYLNRRNATRGYVRYNGFGFIVNSSNDGQNFTGLAITINSSTPSNPTISITASNGLTNGGIQLTGNITGTYTPTYYYASVRNYNNNNTQTYYWTENTNATTTQPTGITNWSDATLTWTITTGGAYASVSSDGLVTITGDPTGNIVVTLTVTKGDYEGTQTFTLTRTHNNENVSTTVTLSDITLSPTSVTLNYGEGQAFTSSASVTSTTATTQAYDRLQGGGNTYYYYGGALHTSTPTAVEVVTHPEPTYSWSLTGAAANGGYLTPTSGSGSSITINYANASANQATATLTVTASTTGASNKTATATITATRTLPTAITASPTSIEVVKDNTGQFTYTLTPTGAYDDVTVTSGNTGIATVSKSGNTITVTGVAKGSTTITLSAARPGSTALTTTVAVLVKEACATPTITINPTTAGNTATVTLSTVTDGASIYYTTDGTDPSTSSTLYSGEFEISNGGTVKAIAVKTDYINSEVASATYSAEKIATPTISITTSGVTFDCATTGVTYYYTTDGSTPTTSSTQWNGTAITGLTAGITIKVIATKQGMISSDPASTIYYPASNVGGGVVTLNDIEDHRWSYYSDASLPSQLHSLSPADVKITYYGNGIMMTGNADYTASSEDYITSTHADYKVGAKVNVGGENENTFVYYKTLERGAATDDPWTYSSGNQSSAASRCPYKPIPNPFQVRPRYKDRGSTDANDFTGWRGFQCWRLKSVTGGKVYSVASGGTALSTGAVINAETEIYFAPNAEYGMEVELEAVWAIAYVKKANQDADNPVGTNNVGYERNFCVPTTGAAYRLYTGNNNQKRITNNNHIPVTISCYYPDGTAPDNTNNSINNTAVTLTADTKFENIPINLTSNALTLNNYDIIIGRGCGTSTINNLQGISAGTTDLDYTIRVESGTITTLSFVSTSSLTVSGRYLVKAILGCDYDRATNTNNKLTVSASSTFFFSRNVGFSGSSNKDQKTFDCVFKSGTYQSSYWNETDQSGTNAYQRIAYLGPNSAGTTYPGIRCVTVEGGDLGGMCGGRAVNDGSNNSTYMTPEVITFDLRIKGGIFHGGVFGGAADNPSIGSRRFIMTGGEIWSWLAGGCNGTGSQSGQGSTDGDSYIYVGGNALIGGDNAMCIQNTNGGQVFGAGRGFVENNGTHRLSSVNNSHVAIADEAVISNNNNNGNYPVGGNVYGGSYNGTIAVESNVYIVGGRVEGSAFGGSYGNTTNIPATNVTMTGGLVTDGVYGGSNSTGNVGTVTMLIDGGTSEGGVYGGGLGTNTASCDVTGTVDITMTGGLVLTGLYGGGNVNSKIGSTATINVNGGQVGTSESNASVYGGGLGAVTRMKGNVTVNVGSRTDCALSGTAVIYGDVYGGSAKGITNCNDGGTARNGSTVTDVTLNKGTINGSLYGGGHGIDNATANVWGPVTVKVYGGTLTGGVYGANNLNGAPQNSVTVDIYGTDAQPENGYAIANVYGGGNQAAYNNASYPTVTVHNNNNSIGNVYGGGNAAAVTNTKVTIFGGNRIGAVYAGGNGTGVANTFQMVTGNAVAKIYGGTIGRVFAGNNSSGIVNGTKYVRINADSTETANAANCIDGGHHAMQIGAVFHGGNQAAGSPGTVRIVCTGNTTAEYIDTLFGGANNANIVNNNMSTAADVALTIDRGYIRSGIFGGNNAGGKVTGNITINLTRNSEGTCAFNYPTVFGGGFGEGTSTGGNITINIGEKTKTATAPTVVATIEGGAVYGGSALGSVNDASNETTTVNIYNGTITGNIYGGGLGEAGDANKGKVNGAVMVNISTEDQTEANCAIDLRNQSIFGCNNTGGSPQGDVTVHVWKTGFLTGNYISAESGTLYAIKEVFGGGNLADYAPAGDNKATVYIHNCVNTVENVYGGGNAAAAKGVVTTIDGGRFDYVFGGGNGVVQAANIGSGGTNLTINAGRINHLFGGSNTNGTISGPMRTNVNYSNRNTSGCDEMIGEFFGGGNLAVIGEPGEGNGVDLNTTIECNTVFGDIYGGSNLADIYGNITLTINGGTITNVYGGSKGVLAGDPVFGALFPDGKSADIHGNVKLNIYGGDIGRAYGGSNINGNITGTIGVDLDWSQSSCSQKEIDYIYGASNDASYTPDNSTAINPTVKLINGTVGVNVYGGGRGATATVTANPKVIVGDATNASNNATVNGDVFGGGDAANVNGSTNVIVGHTSTVLGNVFGGGNAAAIKKVNGDYGNTLVILKDKARVYKNVYGGGNQGVIEGDTKVVVNSATE